MSITRVIDFGFLFLAAVLLLITISNLESTNWISSIRIFLSVVDSFFIPGWVALRLMGIKNLQSIPEILAIAFSLSIGLSAVVFSGLLVSNANSATSLSILAFVLSTLPLARDFIIQKNVRLDRTAATKRYDLLSLLFFSWILVFFLFVTFSLYPQMAFLPDLDINRYVISMRDLIFRNEIFSVVVPWFILSLASTYQLAAAQVSIFQTGLSLLGFMSIIAFFVMARAYIAKIHRHAPILATLFFAVFSGLGWLSYINGTNADSDNQVFSVLSGVRNLSYWDVGYGQGLGIWIWFRDITAGFAILFTLLYLLTRHDLKRGQYVVITSFLIISLSYVHFSELVLFVVLVLFLSAFFPSVRVRLRETAYSSITGLAIILVINLLGIGIGTVNQRYQGTTLLYESILVVLSVVSYVLSRFQRRPQFHIKINSRLLLVGVLSAYFLALLIWLTNPQQAAPFFNEVYGVPWLFYPVLFGVVGAIAIPATIHVLRRYRSDSFVLFVVMLLVSLFMGKVVSLVNSELFLTEYWERRIILYDFAAMAILASIFIMDVVKSCTSQTINSRLIAPNLLRIAFVSLLILGGITSTYMSAQYNLLLVKFTKVDPEKVIDYPTHNTSVLTVTNRSEAISELSDAAYVINRYRIPVWYANSPELPLRVFSQLNGTSAIYLDSVDEKEIKAKYQNGYVASHLIENGIQSHSDKYKLISLPSMSAPVSSSDTVLVIPDDFSNSRSANYYAYDLLSLGHYNYTTSLLSDINTLRKATILIAPSEEIGAKLIELREAYNFHFTDLVILNLDGYGQLSNATETNIPPITSLESSLPRWNTFALGTGTIGIPKLEMSSVLNKTSLGISVDSGNYSLWGVYRKFSEPLDTNKYQTLEFKWFGNGDNRWYVVKVISSSNQYYWFRFQDSWSGWKEVVLPLSLHNGYSVINSIKVQKVALTNAPGNIDRIEFLTESSNVNRGGKFYIAEFKLDGPTSAGIRDDATGRTIDFDTIVSLNHNPNFGTVLSYYDNHTPFISRIQSRNYNVYYLNILPIVDSIRSSSHTGSLYTDLGRLTELLPIDFHSYSTTPTKQEGVIGPEALFNKAVFHGEMLVSGSSGIVGPASNVTISIGNSVYSYDQVTQIRIRTANSVEIRANDGSIGSGASFYPKIYTESASMEITGDPVELNIVLNDGETVELKGSSVSVLIKNADLMVRNPELASKGTIDFSQFTAFGPLRTIFGHNTRTVIINGASMTLTTSDTFTSLENISVEGSISLNPGFNQYDELTTWVNTFSKVQNNAVVFLIIPITVGIYVVSRKLIL